MLESCAIYPHRELGVDPHARTVCWAIFGSFFVMELRVREKPVAQALKSDGIPTQSRPRGWKKISIEHILTGIMQPNL